MMRIQAIVGMVIPLAQAGFQQHDPQGRPGWPRSRGCYLPALYPRGTMTTLTAGAARPGEYLTAGIQRRAA
jgi:hypothetical protein